MIKLKDILNEASKLELIAVSNNEKQIKKDRLYLLKYAWIEKKLGPAIDRIRQKKLGLNTKKYKKAKATYDVVVKKNPDFQITGTGGPEPIFSTR